MTLRTGNKQGFTFIEIMVALIILSVGLVTILKAFVTSVDRMSHLTNRLYATTLLDNHIVSIQRTLRAHNTLPLSLEDERMMTGAKETLFRPKLNISEIADFNEIFKLEVLLTWQEGHNLRQLSRSAYLVDFNE
ncbi:hypothetical protein MNBD_UNCLBAC01-28 [hydrothermal vent metagenome]|uniref:Type II secretion system protein GspI C-terminal domain-containing protein n=1 Tax=hydrothermal vent metagenome TaxID=652676 RepID=A0A3B1DU20_9ZZZZ